MTNCISRCQGAVGITKMKVTKVPSAMPSPLPAGDYGPWLLERFDLGTSDVDRYEGKDADNADADEEEEASHADDGSMRNIEDRGHSRFDLGSSSVDWYEGEDGDDADEEVEASHANDKSTQNVRDWGHSTRDCEDWTVYYKPVKYDNGEANATASDVSEAKTVL